MINLKKNKLIYLIIILIIIVITLLIFDSDDEQTSNNFVPTAIATITPEAIITPTVIIAIDTPTITSSILITPTIEKIQPNPSLTCLVQNLLHQLHFPLSLMLNLNYLTNHF